MGDPRRPGRRRACAGLGLAALALGGCEGAFNSHRDALDAMHADGRYDLAARTLDDPANRDLYGEKNELLWLLDRGAVAQAMDDDLTALDALGRAEQLMDERREESFSESAAVLLMNDTHAPYLGEPYEDIYVNVFKLLAHLEAGRVENAATVEARRMALKGNLLRDEFLRVAPRAREEAGLGSGGGDTGGEFVESTLGLFLSAVAFMHAGDSADQSVAVRRLRQIAEAQGGFIGPVDARAFDGLESVAPPRAGSGVGHVLVVAFSGQGPDKESSRRREGSFFVDLPILRWRASEARGARVVLDPPVARDGAAGPLVGGDTDSVKGMNLVEDLSSVANENHRRQMPIIQARAYARAAAKAVGVGAATWGASRTGNDAITAAVLLGGLALLVASEQADLRAWEFLPGQAHVRLMEVPAGRRDVVVEWVSGAGGTLYASGRRTIDVPEGGLATVVEYWWR